MIEPLILAHLIRDEDFARQTLPFLKEEYFTGTASRELFKQITSFVTSYKTSPTIDALTLGLDKASLSGHAHQEAVTLLGEVQRVERIDSSRRQWLLDQTEEFCRKRALYLAMSDAITRIDKNFDSASGVPDLIRDALRVGFETHIGHDYVEDMAQRYDLYHQTHKRIPFDLDMLNVITDGGLMPKTLNIVVAGTGVGKSLFLCHVAAAALLHGKNILYITLEMAEERIAERIDANLLDISTDMLAQLSRSMYENAFRQLMQRHALGKLIIKEYPTSGAHRGHFSKLLDDLASKKQFFPDLLIIDYINICASERFRPGGTSNSYTYIKSIAEELRGLSVEYNVPCLSATQFTRSGYDSSDPTLTDTSESFGLPQTADLQVALVTSEELEQNGLMMFKQLKNRYQDMSKHRRFTVRLDKSKMRFSKDPNQKYLSDPIATSSAAKPVAPQAQAPLRPARSGWSNSATAPKILF